MRKLRCWWLPARQRAATNHVVGKRAAHPETGWRHGRQEWTLAVAGLQDPSIQPTRSRSDDRPIDNGIGPIATSGQLASTLVT